MSTGIQLYYSNSSYTVNQSTGSRNVTINKDFSSMGYCTLVFNYNSVPSGQNYAGMGWYIESLNGGSWYAENYDTYQSYMPLKVENDQTSFTIIGPNVWSKNKSGMERIYVTGSASLSNATVKLVIDGVNKEGHIFVNGVEYGKSPLDLRGKISILGLYIWNTSNQSYSTISNIRIAAFPSLQSAMSYNGEQLKTDIKDSYLSYNDDMLKNMRYPLNQGRYFYPIFDSPNYENQISGNDLIYLTYFEEYPGTDVFMPAKSSASDKGYTVSDPYPSTYSGYIQPSYSHPKSTEAGITSEFYDMNTLYLETEMIQSQSPSSNDVLKASLPIFCNLDGSKIGDADNEFSITYRVYMNTDGCMFAGYQVPNEGYDKDWYRMAPSVAALGTSFDPSQNPSIPSNRIGAMDFCSTEYPYDVLAYGIDQEAVGTNSGEFYDPTYYQPSVFPPCGRKFSSYYRKNLTNISGDQWYHVTIVVKKMSSSRYDKRLYINGALIGSKYNNGKFVGGIAIEMDPGYEPEHYINEWEMLTAGYVKVAELAVWQKDITGGKSFYEIPDAPLYVKNDQDVYVPNPQLSWI